MYATIGGTVQEREEDAVIVETHGLGFRIYVPISLLPRLPSKGMEIFLYTSFIVREFSHALYGFLQKGQRDLFEILLDAKGVGPKLALSILGHLTTEEILRALRNHDLAMLSRVPGVGKKTAERLLVDLRDKLSHWAPPHLEKRDTPEAALPAYDAIQALIHLGYPAPKAQEAVQECLKESPEPASLPELITAALKKCR